ncbi:hypothetical protein D3C81_1994190 [compost metagenome]
MHQVDPLQGEQVALGNHPAQALAIDHADVGDVPLGHGQGGVEGTGLGRQVEGRLGHDLGDGPGQVGAGVGDHPAQIAQGEDAQRPLAGVDDHDAAHLLFVHQPHGIAQG